ncbi:MAG: glycoside hydrolase family 43 protein [Bifidobacteriaceae bacterium]|jgi:xylan 1,4-beta-xylosidase|nr:glycoside hydrolase family 43 protein [Bifidobacteriaceae bacterium]MCI1914188.1 glycoside hydrolase family 43 protein [Bifidobacteriaceae bacterium]
MQISNPVLKGFYADPSFVRVDDTYYIANSTFEWFPGVQLHESKDLVHWNALPAALSTTTLLDMRGNDASGGIWAPDLSYADGKFWLVYTDVKVVNGSFKDCINYLTTATDIRGPWTDPIVLNGVGFDSSLFHDVDGRKYLVQQTWDHREYRHQFNGITCTEFNTSTMKLRPETARTLWRGDYVKLPEGPHLYRKDGFYYLFVAEGGTTYSHHEVVARSTSLDPESFEGAPQNPFLTNFDTPRTYLQKQGHGALIDTPSGEWYYASLCARPFHEENESEVDPRGWCTLGRETSIQKVEWDESGWPFVVGGHGGTRYVQAPSDAVETVAPANNDQHDTFDSNNLSPVWNTLRVPFDSKMGFVGNGELVLKGQGSLSNKFDLSLVARRWQSFYFTAQTKVNFTPRDYQSMAGLTNYYNDQHWSWVFVTRDEKLGRVIEVAQNDRNNYTTFLRDNAIPVPNDVESVWLRSTVRKQTYGYEYSFDGKNWNEIPVTLESKILSDDYVNQSWGGFFTGAFVGLAAVDYSRYGDEAHFGFFDYVETEDPEDGLLQ